MSAKEGVFGVELGNDDVTKTVLGELATRMGWPGGIKDVTTIIEDLAGKNNTHPAFRTLHENFRAVAEHGPDALEHHNLTTGLLVRVVRQFDPEGENHDIIPGKLVAITGVSSEDPRFLEGIASYEGTRAADVSLRPSELGFVYPC